MQALLQELHVHNIKCYLLRCELNKLSKIFMSGIAGCKRDPVRDVSAAAGVLAPA